MSVKRDRRLTVGRNKTQRRGVHSKSERCRVSKSFPNPLNWHSPDTGPTRSGVVSGKATKPSDGLEPSTPPYHEREEGADSFAIARSVASSRASLVAAVRRVLHVGATLVRPRRSASLNRPACSSRQRHVEGDVALCDPLACPKTHSLKEDAT